MNSNILEHMLDKDVENIEYLELIEEEIDDVITLAE